MAVALIPVAAAGGGEGFHVFTTPSDDRWFYPFNFTPGFRPIGSCFGAAGLEGFNDRDGAVIVAWRTDERIPPGYPEEAYDIRSITVMLTNQASPNLVPQWLVDLTVDEWFTYLPGGVDADPGRPIELFGAAFGPQRRESDWRENTAFIGSTSESDLARDPFPFVFRDGSSEIVHVEDGVKGLHNTKLNNPLCESVTGVCPFTPKPWAIGHPVGYAPGAQREPFDVRFEIDLTLSDGAVRRYFQRQLRMGRVFVYVTSMHEVEPFGPASGFPSFFLKEGVPLDPKARAPSLEIIVALETGDFNEDGFVALDDWTEGIFCLNGPDHAPAGDPQNSERCLCLLDFDDDGDVDLADAARWLRRFTGFDP